jgi:S1-C subfamily serine protease
MKYPYAFAIALLFLAFMFIKDTPTSLSTLSSTGKPAYSTPLDSHAVVSEFTQNLYKATALLYEQDTLGALTFNCTATAFEKTGTTYLALTAKHCVGNEGDAYFLVFDEDSDTPYVKAKLLFKAPDSDAAVFQFNSDVDMPVIRLGDEKLEALGAPVINMASPMGLGKLFFRGSIAALKLVRREQSTSDTKDPIVLELPAAGGSSGSAVCSEFQQAIIGVLVEIYIPKNGGIIATTAVPVSQVREALKQFRAGTLKKEEPKVGLFDMLFSTKKK